MYVKVSFPIVKKSKVSPGLFWKPLTLTTGIVVSSSVISSDSLVDAIPVAPSKAKPITDPQIKVNTKILIRKKDIRSYQADPRLAKKILNWKAKTTFKQIIYKMVNGQLY